MEVMGVLVFQVRMASPILVERMLMEETVEGDLVVKEEEAEVALLPLASVEITTK